MDASGATEGDRLHVLQSFGPPSPQTNPYITQLYESLETTDGVQVVPFSWRNALTRRVDVFHVHLPESLVDRRGFVSTQGRRLLYALFLLRLRLTGTPIVRTLHNLELPEGISWFDRALLRETDRLTRTWIVLNEFTPVPAGAESVLIEHGDYRAWFQRYPEPEPIPGRVAFFGKIRRYKNVDGLVTAFRRIETSEVPLSLDIAGSPSDGMAEQLQDVAGGDPRITLTLGFVDDADLVRHVGGSCVVVLPYPEMHNSGSVLAALSLDRPVLVPDNEVNRALEAEVGPGWVLRYTGALSAEHLVDAVRRSRDPRRSAAPDLGRRAWSDAGPRHLEAYRRALRQ